MMKRYPTYKDSGVEWIGEIPKHWTLIKMKYLGKVIGGFAFKSNDFIDNGIKTIKINNIQNMFLDWNNIAYLPEDYYDKYKEYSVTNGSLLFALTRPIISTGIKASMIEISESEKILINQRTGIFHPNNRIITKIMYFIVNSDYFYHDFYLRIKTTNQPNISTEDIAEIKICLPPLSEQLNIINFLNYKDNQINNLIEKKQKQIDLLKEQRNAIINQAVTKGLDPNVKMKDSGIRWLGKIPEHWELMKVRRIVKMHKQGYYTNRDYVDGGVKLLRITDIDDFSNIDYSECPSVSISEKERKDFSLVTNDFVFARSGTIGRFGIIREKENVVFASYLIRFRFTEKVGTEFLKYYFLSDYFKQSLISDLHGGANQNIHAENIKNQFIAVPPPDEQLSIYKFIENEITGIDTIIAKTQISIEFLNEYRTALISEVVTGKIDVRDEVDHVT